MGENGGRHLKCVEEMAEMDEEDKEEEEKRWKEVEKRYAGG
jgi:hypothetical protein